MDKNLKNKYIELTQRSPLGSLQGQYAQATEKASRIPEGIYDVRIESVKLIQTPNLVDQLVWKMRIVSGDHQGKSLEHRNSITDSDSTMLQLEKDCRVSGNPLNSLEDLEDPNYLNAFSDLPLRVQVVHKDKSTTTYFKELR